MILVHAINRAGWNATALCGASPSDDDDAPASDDWKEVNCPACYETRAKQPHCLTCGEVWPCHGVMWGTHRFKRDDA